MSSLLNPVYKLCQENSHSENMCDIVFEKSERRGGTINRTSAKLSAESAVGRAH